MINFSRIPENAVGKLLRFPLKFIPSDAVVPILQGSLRGTKWIVGSSHHGCWLGCYQSETRSMFEKFVHERSIVFDIGAQAGFFTLLASRLVGSRGRVFAFEPAPRNIFYLKKHLDLNRITNVTVIEAAVSDRAGVADFDRGPGFLGGHLSDVCDDWVDQPNGKIRVRTLALDEGVRTSELSLPDVIKIDTEGAEMLVLKGALSIIQTAHPTLFLDTHPFLGPHGLAIQQQTRQYLGSLGYQLMPAVGHDLARTNEVIARFERK